MFTPSQRGEASKQIVEDVILRNLDFENFLRAELLTTFEVAVCIIDARLQALELYSLSAVNFMRNVQLGERGCRSRRRSVEAAAKR